MRRLRIGFDVDGVLANFEKYYLGRAKELWPDYVRKSEWDFGLTKDQQDVLWKEIRGTMDFWNDLEVIGDQHLLMNDLWLANRNHTLVFVTSRVPTLGASTELQTARWLDHELDVDYPTVIVVDHWYEKAPLYKHLHLDAYIDDKGLTVDRMSQLGQNIYVFDQDWNRDCSKVVPRVKTIREYIQKVEEQLG